MNITIPGSLYERLKGKPNKSAFIAQAVKEKLAAEELSLAYRQAAEQEKKLLRHWDATAGDGL